MPAPSFSVNVKDFQGRSVVIKVNPSWAVAEVKQEISRHTSVPPSDFKLVFAGMTLADTQTLWDIGVQGYSTLHCIRGRLDVQVTMTSPLKDAESQLGTMNIGGQSPTAVQPQPQEGTTRNPQHRFYVYCKKPCGAMAPGKLRVRCANCKDTSFVLRKGPGSWDDVLRPRRLQGHCNREGCDGTDAEFFFKCANHPTADTDECVALHMVRVNSVDVECASCLVAQEMMVVFNCPDKHCMCVDCFMQYCEVQLTNRQFEEHQQIGYTIRCPAQCDGSQITESHHFRLGLKKELYDRYQRFGTEEFVLKMGGVLCPQANCGMGLLPEDGGRRIHCPRENGGCGFTFCRNCKEAYHNGACRQAPQSTQQGQQYQLDPEALERARWVQANERFIESNTKACPRCRVPIEKNGGCMHMTCGISSCRFEWCWICGVEWNRQCQSSHWFG